jgi:hypothetical protein
VPGGLIRLCGFGRAGQVRELADQAAAGKLPLAQAATVVKARKLGKAKAEPGGQREFKYPDGTRVGVTLAPGMAGPTAVAEAL